MTQTSFSSPHAPGPLMYRADVMAKIGYLDEWNFWQGDDDHDVNGRAYKYENMSVGFLPIDWYGNDQFREQPQLQQQKFGEENLEKYKKEREQRGSNGWYHQKQGVDIPEHNEERVITVELMASVWKEIVRP